jgi:hypothetical protein
VRRFEEVVGPGFITATLLKRRQQTKGQTVPAYFSIIGHFTFFYSITQIGLAGNNITDLPIWLALLWFYFKRIPQTPRMVGNSEFRALVDFPTANDRRTHFCQSSDCKRCISLTLAYLSIEGLR